MKLQFAENTKKVSSRFEKEMDITINSAYVASQESTHDYKTVTKEAKIILRHKQQEMANSALLAAKQLKF